jgi:hypothetical protein
MNMNNSETRSKNSLNEGRTHKDCPTMKSIQIIRQDAFDRDIESLKYMGKK